MTPCQSRGGAGNSGTRSLHGGAVHKVAQESLTIPGRVKSCLMHFRGVCFEENHMQNDCGWHGLACNFFPLLNQMACHHEAFPFISLHIWWDNDTSHFLNSLLLHRSTPMPPYKHHEVSVGSQHCHTLLLKYLNTQTHCGDDTSLNKRFTLPCFDVWINRLVQQR